MTDAAKYLLKKYGVLVGIVLIYFGLFFSIAYLRKQADITHLTDAADTLCRSYAGFNGQPVAITGIAKNAPAGIPFRAVLTAQYAGHDALVFLLPLTGKYGIYPAVFFYEQSMGCVFCGLAGVNAPPEEAAKYGITHTALAIQQKKLETLMSRQMR